MQTGRAVDPVTRTILEPTSRFSTTDPEIHVSARLESAPEGTVVRAIFRYAEGVESEIAEASVVAGGTRYVSFTLRRPPSGWSAGRYVVSLFLGEAEVHRQSFTIGLPSGFVRFSEPRFGIAFDVPAAWTRSVSADGDYVFRGHPATEEGALQLRLQFVSKALNPDSSLLAQAELAETKLREQALPDRIFRSTTKLAGRTVPYFIAAFGGGEAAKEDLGYTLVILEGARCYYWLSFHGPGSLYKEKHELFERILATVAIE